MKVNGSLVLTLAAWSTMLRPVSAQPPPDFADMAGRWTVEGSALPPGNDVECHMQTTAADGRPFVCMTMISNGPDGSSLAVVYIVPTQLPDNSAPKVAISFDGAITAELTGSVAQGQLYTDLALLGVSGAERVIKRFGDSRQLVETVTLAGYPTERVVVDVTDAAAALTKQSLCSKTVTAIGKARANPAP